MKKQVTFWIDEDIRDRFSIKYNSSMSKFFRNCIILALRNNNFFHDVYFMDDTNENSSDDIKKGDIF